MNKKLWLLLGSLFVFLVSLFLSVKTYARYHTRININSATITTASWNFEANDEVSNFAIDLGYLYPGVNRSFDVELSSVGSDVPIDYIITFSNPVGIPNKLTFYPDASKEHTINLSGGTIAGEMEANTTMIVTVYYDWEFAGAEQFTPGTATFSLSVLGRQKNPNS